MKKSAIFLILLILISCERNSAPTAKFYSNPGTGTTTTNFVFIADSVTDAESPADQLQIRWDWASDGMWDTEYSSNKQVVHRFEEPGIFNINLEVKDPEGYIDHFSRVLTVLKVESLPKAVIKVSRVAGTTDTLFLFDALKSTDAETLFENLLTRWDFENDGFWNENYSTAKSITHQFTVPGIYKVRLQVKDEDGLVGTDSTLIQVSSRNNTAPQALFNINPSTGTTLMTISFDAEASYDYETAGENLEIRWDWENNGVWDTDFSTSKKAKFKFAQAGTYSVKLQVRDEEGLSDTEIKTIKINTDNPPTASFTINPATGTTITPFVFSAASSSDPETPSDLIFVRWDWTNDGTWDTGFQLEKSATHIFPQPGTFSIRLQVKDGGGLTTEIIKTLNVIQYVNTPPDAGFTASPSNLAIKTDLIFNASPSSDRDTPADKLQYRWDWTNDGTWDTDYTNTLSATHQYTDIGYYRIKLQIMDEGGLTDTISNYYRIGPGGDGTITDSRDGIVYWYKNIGNQTWLAENLRATKYLNGDPVPNITDAETWYTSETGAYCNYDHIPGNSNLYGRLYNWYVTVDSRKICPGGWHVPVEAEWVELTNYLGGSSVAGNSMKATGTKYWLAPNSGATNSSGFTALPFGYLNDWVEFSGIKYHGTWWSATEYQDYIYYALRWYISASSGSLSYIIDEKIVGASIRCVKD